jgi:hypothetical protein
MQPRYFIYLVCAIALAAQSWTCRQSAESCPPVNSAEALVAVELESDFQNDSVKVEFDSQIWFLGRATTNFSVARAWGSGSRTVSAGIHTVKVTVYTDIVMNQLSTDIENTVTITANYNRQTRQLAFRTYNFLIFRD